MLQYLRMRILTNNISSAMNEAQTENKMNHKIKIFRCMLCMFYE